MAEIPGATLLCGLQIACYGNEAQGFAMLSDGDDPQIFQIPCCEECFQAMEDRHCEVEETIQE